jgi:hypothetical protein
MNGEWLEQENYNEFSGELYFYAIRQHSTFSPGGQQ